jgi:hypothetical protein
MHRISNLYILKLRCHITMDVRQRLLKCLVICTLLYGCIKGSNGMWRTTYEEDFKAAEIWFVLFDRRMTSLADKNEEVNKSRGNESRDQEHQTSAKLKLLRKRLPVGRKLSKEETIVLLWTQKIIWMEPKKITVPKSCLLSGNILKRQLGFLGKF